MGTSPVLLLSVFVGTFVLWLVYSSTGIIRLTSPGVMGTVEAVPPLHSLLDTVFLIDASRLYPATVTLPLAGVLLVVRSLLMAFWIEVVLESGQRVTGRWAPARAVAPRILRSTQRVLPVDAAFLLLMFIAPILLGAIFGPVGSMVALVAVAYFLVYAPVVAVREGPGTVSAFRLAYRGSRLRGPQHILLVFPYVLASLFLAIRPYGGLAEPATPSFLTWVFVLVLNFLHVSVLAALAHRWLAVRERIPIPEKGSAPSRLRFLSGLR